MENSAYLVLQNGTVFRGASFGHRAEVMGELIFTTSSAAYLEILTDSSYYGKLVSFTFPMVGNYGVIEQDFESDIAMPKAIIAGEWCKYPSNFRSGGSLDDFLRERGVVGLSGINTRALTKVIRENHTMNACITSNPASVSFEGLAAHKRMCSIRDVGTKSVVHEAAEQAKCRVAVWDFGVSRSVVEAIKCLGCEVVIVPHTYSAAQLLELKPQGIVLSNGPENAAESAALVQKIKELIGARLPILAIGLGHTLLAQAHGMSVQQLKHGRYGSNIASKSNDGRLIATRQSRMLCVNANDSADVLYTNVNDGTVEGLKYRQNPFISVHFYPHRELYAQFLSLMGKESV